MIITKFMAAVALVSALAFAYLELTGTTHVIETIRCTRSGCGSI
jgi:hypothetical protein